jgi:pyroglutamyl-peptidase
MKILVTGFEPFGGSGVNPSEQVVKALTSQKLAGVEITTCILPVDQGEAGRRLLAAYQSNQPDVVLCLGEASQRPVISVERVAVNLMDYRIPDNQGNQVIDLPVIPGAPAAYFSTLPVRNIYDRLILAGIPVELSLSAGTFLCNQVFFTIIHAITGARDSAAAGFIHLPALPEQAAAQQKNMPTMGLTTTLLGVIKAIEAIRDWRIDAGLALNAEENR